MNSIKAILVSAIGLALPYSVHAQTVIRIVGSDGDRAATNQAIRNLLTGTVTFAGVAPQNASDFSIFTGTFNGTSVTIKTSFIGAFGAIKAVAGKETVPFLPNGATGTSNPSPLTSSHEDAVPDFGVSNNFQATSHFQGTYNGHSYINLTEILTGVIGLRFIASPGFPTDNITTAQAQSLYSAGRLYLSFFTALSTHHNKQVFALGRNTDSGERYGELAEIGLGVNSVVKQYKPLISGGHVMSHTLWPVETISGLSSMDWGNSGFSSGALLAASLPVVLDANAYKVGDSGANAGYYIGYLTPADANTVLPPNNNAVPLKWNGVPYSDTNVRQGLYTAWLYTRVIYDPELINYNNIAYRLATGVAAGVRDTTITSVGGGVNLDSMVVERNAEGALLSPNIYF